METTMYHEITEAVTGKRRITRTVLVAALQAALASMFMLAQAQATSLATGNPDLEVRWDNTLRYTAGVRAERQNQKFINHPYYQESDLKFDRGDLVTNRVDLLSEFDVVWKRDLGFRVSATAWYDHAYNDTRVRTNPALDAAGFISSYKSDQYSSLTRRYYRGVSGEILDAFVFGQFLAGNVPVNVKLGRHTNYWGESLFAAYTGVNYGQAPVDVRKALANPGAEAKELFMPLSQISAQAQLTDEVSMAAYYGLEWKADRLPEGGTYLSDLGFLFDGPDRLPVGGGFALSRADSLRPKDRGDFGINTRWSPKWLDGTIGAYYRRFDEKLPWVQVDPATLSYRLAYARNTELFGLSLSKVISGVSVGAELAYRRDAGLLSANVNPADNQGARGDTLHGLVNGIWYFSNASLFNSAVLIGELNWTHRLNVGVNPELFNGLGYASCIGKDKWDGCTTRNATGGSVAFIPTWTQVAPSVDLSMPLAFGIGIKGNGATPGSPNQGVGSYSIGLSALVQNKYQVDLKMNDYLVRYKDNGTTVTSVNGQSPSLLSDRRWVVLSVKTSF